MKHLVAWLAFLLCQTGLAQDKIIVSGASGQLGRRFEEGAGEREIVEFRNMLASAGMNENRKRDGRAFGSTALCALRLHADYGSPHHHMCSLGAKRFKFA